MVHNTTIITFFLIRYQLILEICIFGNNRLASGTRVGVVKLFGDDANGLIVNACTAVVVFV